MIMSSVYVVFQLNTINGGAGVSPTTEVCSAAAHLIYCVLLNKLSEWQYSFKSAVDFVFLVISSPVTFCIDLF